jgi:hypothetical protein
VVYPTNENGGSAREGGRPRDTHERARRDAGGPAYAGNDEHAGNDEYYPRGAAARYPPANVNSQGSAGQWIYSENGNYQDSAGPGHYPRSEGYQGTMGEWGYSDYSGYADRGRERDRPRNGGFSRSEGAREYPGNGEYYPGGTQGRNYPGSGVNSESTAERRSLGNGSYPGRTAEQRYGGNGHYPGSGGYPETPERAGYRGFAGRPVADDERVPVWGRRERGYQPGATARGHALPPRPEPPRSALPQPSPSVSGDSGESRSWRAFLRQEWTLVIFCSCIAGIALMYNLFGAADVLYDEAAYTYAAQQVAQGWHLTLETQPFFVHPPLPFLLEGAWLRITGQSRAALPSAIHTARILAASAGVLDVLLVACLTYQLAADAPTRRRRVLTGLVAFLTAFDPVLARYDRQDVIEPFALCASLIALYAAWTLRNRTTFVYISTTGPLIGFALLSNQITIFLLIVPLIHAVLERNRRLIRRTIAALAVGLGLASTFFLWAIELGLGGKFITVQTITLQRLIGLIQVTGLNMPGVSLVGSLERSVTQYSSSYIAMMVGSLALIWCWTRRNNERGKFLTAWLTASYAFGAYIAGIGTLNEQFFVYLLPATIVGTVMFGDAIMGRWSRLIARRFASRGSSRLPRLPLVAAVLGCVVISCISAASWVRAYSGSSDGVIQVDRVISTQLPACTVVNASGDPEKYSYLLNRRYFSTFSVGPAALADGVHYFILAPIDVIERTGNMSPALENWIRTNGKQLYSFPSTTYRSVELWYVPASRYDPVADIQDIAGGVYINTTGSDCGGYTVTDSKLGSFYSGYQSLGGKSMLGDPLGQSVMVSGGHEQLFDGAVLATSAHGGSTVQAVPIVATLASKSPAMYRKAGLPAVVVSGASAATKRSWLTNSAIARAYLGGGANTQRAYDAAVERYGEPLGPPATLAGGTVGQAFADVVLEVSNGRGSIVHAAPVTQDVLNAKLLSLPSAARALQAGPSLGGNPLTPPPTGPTSVKPFVLTLGGAIVVFGLIVLTLARRRRRRGLPAEAGSQRYHTT